MWNEATLRLVVHGSVWEHGMVTGHLSELGQPMRVVTTVRLLKVPCRELGVVSWSAEEVAKRGGEVLASASSTSRPGQRATKTVPGGLGPIMEVIATSDGSFVDVRFELSAPVEHPEGMRKVELATGVTVLAGREFFIEMPVELTLTGARPVRLSTELLLKSGQPLLLPVRGTGGTMTGVVFEVRMIDPAGRDWRRADRIETD